MTFQNSNIACTFYALEKKLFVCIRLHGHSKWLRKMHAAKREVLDAVESFNLNLLLRAELLKLSVMSRVPV
jgi:hypothetical protein